MSQTRPAKEIFADAIELAPEEREWFLRGACAGDAGLLAEVKELVTVHEGARQFLGAPTIAPPAGAAASRGSSARSLVAGVAGAGGAGGVIGERPGSVVGRYRLLEMIGEGGFGAVFMAEQREPVVRRVAVKIIKPGMDTAQVIARFEAERQALAIMDHPNIAKVLDAGATSSGRPYFVMELVKGVPITDYADTNSLTIGERLELFTQVCQAVQHAHTKGVIHRDIKPSNILVGEQDGRPLARVIDFGIAKAMDRRLTEKTVFTEFRQMVGTPEYMSPEQAAGGPDIDTRTDVYSLGVLLYELLTGSTPFDGKSLRSAAYGEIARIIREEEPEKPSTRLSRGTATLPGVAAHRRTEPRTLGTMVRGDLDWIVMKALDKSRARRYETPGALAADVQRHLAGEAVTAAPPSAAYRLRKFVGRHRASVTAGGLVLAAMVLGVAGTSVGMVRARAQRDRAVAAEGLAKTRLDEAEKARAAAERANKIASDVTEFFTLDVLDLTPTPPGQPELTVRQALDRVPAKIDQFFKSEPAVEGSIRERVGQLYFNMGDPRRAAGFLEGAVPLLEQGLGADDRATLRARQRLGELMMDLERYGVAEEMFDKVYQSRLRVLGPNHNFTINSLARRGMARVWGGKVEDGLRDAEKARDEFARARGRISQAAFVGVRNLAECYVRAGRLGEAEQLVRSSLEDIRTHPEQIGPAEPSFRLILASVLLSKGQPEGALEEVEAVYQVKRKEVPESHPDLVEMRAVRARALAGAHRDAQAAAELEAVYRILEPLYGAGAERCRSLARVLAEVAARQNDEAGAAKWKGRS